MKRRVLAVMLGAVALGGASLEAARRPKLEAALARAQVRRQMHQAFSGMIRAAVPDPKGEYAALLAKTGFVLLSERDGPRLWTVENPDTPFLRRVAALYQDPEAAEKLLRLFREDEPQRTAKLASYTIHRVLERLERDRQEHRLRDAARRDMARAVIEEMVATASIDSSNQILETLRALLAERRVRDQDLVAYGFTLVEYESPGPNEWKALLQDARLFCVRFSPRGFTVYRAGGRQKQTLSYSISEWRDETLSLLGEITARNNAAGKSWMGISPD